MITEAQVGKVVTNTCEDTGSCRTIFSVSFAQACNLPIRWAQNADCGTFQVPGAPNLQAYAGVVEEVPLRFSRDIEFLVRGVRIVTHPYPLCLIGSDILRGGRPGSEINFRGITFETLAPGKVQGYLTFTRQGRAYSCPTVNVPSEGVAAFAFNPSAAAPPVNVAPPPLVPVVGAVIPPPAAGAAAVTPEPWARWPGAHVPSGVNAAALGAPTFNMVAGAATAPLPDRVFRDS